MNYNIGRLVLNSLCVGDLVRLVFGGVRFAGWSTTVLFMLKLLKRLVPMHDPLSISRSTVSVASQPWTSVTLLIYAMRTFRHFSKQPTRYTAIRPNPHPTGYVLYHVPRKAAVTLCLCDRRTVFRDTAKNTPCSITIKRAIIEHKIYHTLYQSRELIEWKNGICGFEHFSGPMHLGPKRGPLCPCRMACMYFGGTC